MLEADPTKLATDQAVLAFQRVERKRLGLDMAEHNLCKCLRNAGVNLASYKERTQDIADGFAGNRVTAREIGLLPEEE